MARALHAVGAQAVRATAGTQSALAYAALVALAVVVLFPFYWMTITSFQSEDQMRSLVSMFWPRPLVTETYDQLLSKTAFVSWYANSATVAISSTLITYLVPPLQKYMVEGLTAGSVKG
jgi:multiple sugar transport system permease protein